MKPSSERQDELIMLRLSQFEKVSSILFFLIPLVILLVAGKPFAANVLYLWQVLSLLYIVIYRTLVRKLSNQELQLSIRRGWGYNRFYRLCWVYLTLSILIMVGYSLVFN